MPTQYVLRFALVPYPDPDFELASDSFNALLEDCNPWRILEEEAPVIDERRLLAVGLVRPVRTIVDAVTYLVLLHKVGQAGDIALPIAVLLEYVI